MIFWLAWTVFWALVAGAIARFVIPGKDPLGCFGTFMLGFVGSFIGGFLGNLFFSGSIFDIERAGLLGSIVGAIIALLIYRAIKKGQSLGDDDQPAS